MNPVFLCLLFCLITPGSGDIPFDAQYARLLDGRKDVVIRRAFVPSRIFRQGEVRLLRRDGAAVMQTILYTRYLRRVIGRIREKELRNWPSSREGHEDRAAYVRALEESGEEVRRRFEARENPSDRHKKMLIEFILSKKDSVIAFALPELEEENNEVRITKRTELRILPASRTYVRGNIYEIAKDAFSLSDAEARKLLEPVLPPEPKTVPERKEPAER
jgi:hypothetical protein